MTALCEALGRPQDRFESAHVVGTNGKTSVTRMAAAILADEGRPTGWLTSPHFSGWAERLGTGGPDVAPPDFERAVETVADACAEVGESLPDAGHPTQFEVSVAAGFLALADAGVETAVIEAGLGGRLDATNVIDSKVTALVSVGMDHAEWLGDDELSIATEKLAVLTPGSVLVTGPLAPEVDALAAGTAEALDCDLVRVSAPPEGGYPALNLAVAIQVANVLLGSPAEPSAAELARELVIPGRLELVSTDPPVIFDVAHNRPGARALAEALPAVAANRPVVGCFGVASDKDATGILEELGRGMASLVVTAPEAPAGSPPGRGPADPESLAEAALVLGIPVEISPEPARALELAREKARDVEGLVLLFGSHSLFGALDRDT